MRLPQIQYKVTKNEIETVAMRGINFSDAFKDGDMADSKNISARRYPTITTRKARTQEGTYSNVTSISAWGKLVVVDGTNLYFDGVLKGQVTAGEKQFAIVNTKVVIMPDKVYYDIPSGTLNPMGATATVTGITFTTNSMTVTGSLAAFKAGDTIEIKNSSIAANNKFVTIKEISGTTITVADNTFEEGASTSATLERSIPEMDFICESDNRLWGCSTDDQTIYASALGDPTNFYTFEGLSTDSYQVGVGTEGSFTGCCKYASTVLFWKETKLHKLLGSYPADYALYTYDVEGLQAGSHKSMQVINQVLYYKGPHGVFAYTGGIPAIISTNFGEKKFTDGVSGNDGDTYYLSVKEGSKSYLFAYETVQGLWVKEDEVYCNCFATIGTDCYAVIDQKVYKLETEDSVADLEWMINFKPLYETIKGRKIYSKMIMRTEIPRGSYMKVFVSQDGKPFKEVARLTGTGATPFRLPITRCDKYEIKLEGKGEMAILDMLREVSIGSEV